MAVPAFGKRQLTSLRQLLTVVESIIFGTATALPQTLGMQLAGPSTLVDVWPRGPPGEIVQEFVVTRVEHLL